MFIHRQITVGISLLRVREQGIGLASEVKLASSLVEKPQTIASLRDRIAAGHVKATDLATDYYARIDEKNPHLNVFLSLTKDRALAQAAHIDDLASKGDPLPAL